MSNINQQRTNKTRRRLKELTMETFNLKEGIQIYYSEEKFNNMIKAVNEATKDNPYFPPYDVFKTLNAFEGKTSTTSSIIRNLKAKNCKVNSKEDNWHMDMVKFINSYASDDFKQNIMPYMQSLDSIDRSLADLSPNSKERKDKISQKEELESTVIQAFMELYPFEVDSFFKEHNITVKRKKEIKNVFIQSQGKSFIHMSSYYNSERSHDPYTEEDIRNMKFALNMNPQYRKLFADEFIKIVQKSERKPKFYIKFSLKKRTDSFIVYVPETFSLKKYLNYIYSTIENLEKLGISPENLLKEETPAGYMDIVGPYPIGFGIDGKANRKI